MRAAKAAASPSSAARASVSSNALPSRISPDLVARLSAAFVESTYTPEPLFMRTSPFASRAIIASRMVGRLTENCSANSRSGGSRPPAG